MKANKEMMEIFERIKNSCVSFGQARRIAANLSELPEEKRIQLEKKLFPIKTTKKE